MTSDLNGVLIMATLDTKGPEALYLKQKIVEVDANMEDPQFADAVLRNALDVFPKEIHS